MAIKWPILQGLSIYEILLEQLSLLIKKKALGLDQLLNLVYDLYMSNEYKDLLDSLSPSQKEYSKYAEDSSSFFAVYSKQLPLESIDGLVIEEFRFIKSDLFEQRYLVASINSDFFSSSHVSFDAAAIKCLSPIMNVESPPLVLIERIEKKSKEENYRSILEHEFIHINQAILKKFPKPIEMNESTNINSLYEIFLDNIKAEYQANFIQLSNYPKLFPDELNIPLNQWCMLRGFTQSLEKLLLSYIYSMVELNELRFFLKKFQSSVTSDFKKIGLIEEAGKIYAEHLNEYLLTALKILQESNIALSSFDKFIELQAWCNSSKK
jgi:hypothetical protein